METKSPKALKLLFFFVFLLVSIIITVGTAYVSDYISQLLGITDVNPFFWEVIILCLAFAYWYADDMADSYVSQKKKNKQPKTKKSE